MKTKFAALTALATLAALPATVRAEDEASPLTFNIGAVTEYRYRGISQSRLDPALQGGADYAHPSGLYIGTWASTIKWIKDAGEIAGVDTGNATFEWDFYGGYKGEISKDVTYDVGGLYYYYMNNKYANVPGGANANTFELYGAISLGSFTGKYSRSMTNLFGFADSKGSGYLDFSFNADLGDGWSLVPHLGYQQVEHYPNSSYTDYALTLGKDLGKGFSVSLAFIGTDAADGVYSSPSGKNLGKNTVVLGLKFAL